MPAIHFGPNDDPTRESVASAVAKFALSLAAIGFVDYFIFRYAVSPNPFNISIAVAIHLLYFLISYWIRPAPDESDLGLLGPFMDDPFSHSDDTNRSLLHLQILLLPGQLTVDASIALVRRCFRS